MSAHFYFRKGMRFWKWHDRMKSLCDFEINPRGAPLGEEVTKHDDFMEASCQVRVRFDGLPESSRATFAFDSQRHPWFEDDKPSVWNLEGDSLIHRISIGFDEVDIHAGPYSGWPQRMDISRKSYLLYKEIFSAFECEEAEGFTNELLRVFHWVKGAPIQTVIYPFEDGRDATDDSYGDWNWFGPRDSDLVFGRG